MDEERTAAIEATADISMEGQVVSRHDIEAILKRLDEQEEREYTLEELHQHHLKLRESVEAGIMDPGIGKRTDEHIVTKMKAQAKRGYQVVRETDFLGT